METVADTLIFAYGSLVAELAGRGQPALLRDHRRVWGVAADNRRAIPGYKRYRRRDDGSFPEVFVAFLDVVAAPGVAVNGIVAAVSDRELAELDRRERNYDRVEVTAAIDFPGDGRVWTYAGSAEGRARLAAGVAAGSAVAPLRYRDRVVAAFDALGAGERAAFDASTDLGALPLADLQRVDLQFQESRR